MATNSSTKKRPAKLHLKRGDKVLVLSGNSRGKTGEVVQVFPAKSRAIVQGVNMVKKHVKATQDDAGGIQEMEASIHISNLQVIDPTTNQAGRVGRKEVDGKSVRYSKKTGNIIN